MVKYSRSQSTDAPRRFIWSVMALPYCRFHSHTRSMNFSRPSSLRFMPSLASWRSTIICVAMPAHDDVHLRLVEHVAHVQAAGNVGRRQQQGEDRLCGADTLVREALCRNLSPQRRLHREQLLADPVFGPAFFDGAGFVGFGEIGHFSF